MSINSILSLARTALLTHQAALEVTGHNIANAETEGYSRQELQLGPGSVLRQAYGNFGTGVDIVNVARIRETLLDQNVRAQNAPASSFSTRSQLLARVEAVFGEPSDTGLASSLDAFWNAWSDLAMHPSNAGAKTTVQQRALQLTGKFNDFSQQLTDIATDARGQVGSSLARVNELTTQIASINNEIVASEAAGKTAGDLRDTRDKLIDELSALVPVDVIDRADGSNQINIGGMPIVDGPSRKDLQFNPGPPMTVHRAGDTEPLQRAGGKIGALLGVINNDIPSAQSALDALASALITDVNALHATGWSPPSGSSGNWDPLAGPTGSGVLFFDTTPANVNARNIRLSAAVNASALAIASGDGLNETGNNNIANAMAALRDFSTTAPGNSFGEAFRSLVTTVANSARSAQDSADVSQTLVDQAMNRRSSVSGVNTDEELMRLMRHQQAYAAAAKIIQVVDEMSQTLLSIK